MHILLHYPAHGPNMGHFYFHHKKGDMGLLSSDFSHHHKKGSSIHVKVALQLVFFRKNFRQKVLDSLFGSNGLSSEAWRLCLGMGVYRTSAKRPLLPNIRQELTQAVAALKRKRKCTMNSFCLNLPKIHLDK